MDRAAIANAFEGLRKLANLGRWMEGLRRSDRPADVDAAAEIMSAGRTKLQKLHTALQGAPEPYAGLAREAAEALSTGLSATPKGAPLDAVKRAERHLDEAEARLAAETKAN